MVGEEEVMVDLGQQRRSATYVGSYLYLRMAIVLLLVGLAAAVFYQSWQQGAPLLASVSAYYYTPAQAIFVGALIGLGACMVALKGMTVVEDVFLNLGGIFAAVVAIVPTSRGADFKALIRACKEAEGQVLAGSTPGDPDCPAAQALEDATRANVENSLVALLVLGFLALVIAVVFYVRGTKGALDRRWILLGLVVAGAVWVLGLAARLWFMPTFIDYGHYVAALGLFACVVIVAVANAWRRQQPAVTSFPQAQASGGSPPSPPPPGGGSRPPANLMIGSPARLDLYAWIAWVMVIVGAGGIALAWSGVISVFWLEIVVAGLFASFWLVQTLDIGDQTLAVV